MKALKLIAALSIGAALSACGSVPDIASRNAPFEATASQPVSHTAPVRQFRAEAPRSLKVAAINVNVPRNLKVSEANGYYPKADIVWRGDAYGDRYQQIQSIFESAFANGTKDMAGETPVVLDVELIRFHSVTERARFRIGGVHNMHFYLTVRSAKTGQIIEPRHEIEANLPALGGMHAISAESRGQTQKVRVIGFLSHVIQQELRDTVAYAANTQAQAGVKKVYE